MTTTSAQAAIDYVHTRRAEVMAGFQELLTIPSISTDPAYKAECDPYSAITSLQTFVIPAVFKRQKEIGSIGTVDDLRA